MLDRFETFSLAISGIYRCLHKIETDEMSKFGLIPFRYAAPPRGHHRRTALRDVRQG